jgi:hypothetical protein
MTIKSKFPLSIQQEEPMAIDKVYSVKTYLDAKPRQKVKDTHATFHFRKNILPIESKEYVVILGISPRESYHVQNYFKTTIQLLKDIFPRLRVVLILGDWVLAHALHQNDSSLCFEECVQEAEKFADDWLNEVQKDGYLKIIKSNDLELVSENNPLILTVNEEDIIRGSDFAEKGRYNNDYKIAQAEIKKLLKEPNVKNIVNSYLGNRKEKYELFSEADYDWAIRKDKDFTYNEMVGQQVVIKHYPEADYVFYPGCNPSPFSVLYNDAKNKGRIKEKNHAWVKIQFFTKDRAEAANNKLMTKILNQRDDEKNNKALKNEETNHNNIEKFLQPNDELLTSKKENIRGKKMRKTDKQTLFSKKGKLVNTEIRADTMKEAEVVNLPIKNQDNLVRKDSFEGNITSNDKVVIDKQLLMTFLYTYIEKEIAPDQNKLHRVLEFLAFELVPKNHNPISHDKDPSEEEDFEGDQTTNSPR